MRIALWISTLMVCGAAEASAAGCEFDLASVREAALAAGPLRMVERFAASDGKTSARSSMIVMDLIRPDRLRRISILEDGKVGLMVVIAGSGWSGGIERKWEPLNADSSRKMLDAVMLSSPWPAASAKAHCAPTSDSERTVTFTFETTEPAAVTKHEVVVDRQTRKPLRYHAHRTVRGGSTYTDTDRTFQFIGTLAIEPPH